MLWFSLFPECPAPLPMIHLLALTNTAHYVQKAGLSLGGHGQDADEPGVNNKPGRCVSRTVNTTISRAPV